MAFIYKITNKINGKSYIGKTELDSIEKRFKLHIQDSRRERCKDRPLYRAFNKYGVENFEIALIEETNNPEEREMYYIKYFGTYGRTGYNGTLGGDGKRYITTTDEEFIEYFIGEGNRLMGHTAAYFDVHVKTLREILRKNNINIPKNNMTSCKKVSQYTKEGEYIQTFDSIVSATRHLGVKVYEGKISMVCRGQRKSAYGYTWKFEELQ